MLEIISKKNIPRDKARVTAIGIQDFETLITNHCFYVDKTMFIKEWWESRDPVTLITRPRRFGKTLNMSMLNRFFNLEYQEQGEIFQNLSIWQDENYHKLQGTYPVISLSFAGVKEDTYKEAMEQIYLILINLYSKYDFLRNSGVLTEKDRAYFDSVGKGMSSAEASMALCQLSNFLYRYYGKKVIILLDEYDTPMHEAYIHGFWKELVSFTRSLFNNTFKTNPYLERAVMTGITRVSRESMFSDLNNLKLATITSDKYASYFGFTEQEVFSAMEEYGMKNLQEVKKWYDGFTIGSLEDIYNPWSIINFLDTGTLGAYWANSSANGMVRKLLQEGSQDLKMQFESLLAGQSIQEKLEEEIVFERLSRNDDAVLSLLLAGGYLKAVDIKGKIYELKLTNYEVRQMFEDMILEWFTEEAPNYNRFVKALLLGDLEAMNEYMNRMTCSMFSSFDSGKKPSVQAEPERFYHGFVLGLLVELADRYIVNSNRESSFGRYDVMIKPKDRQSEAMILEFKVYNPRKEQHLQDTVKAALLQIEEKKYEQVFIDEGIPKEQIRKYAFAFKGKKVLIGS